MVSLSVLGAAAHAQTVFVNVQTGLLGTMDPITGVYQEIGETIVNGDTFATTLLDIAVDSDGIIYGSALGGNLLRIDPNDVYQITRFGSPVNVVRTTVIGPQGLPFWAQGLAINPLNGKLYGYDNDFLYTFDKATGAGAKVGADLDPNRPNVLGDIAFDAQGRLFGFSHLWTYQFNLNTGNATNVGTHNYLGAYGAAFRGSVLYGYSQHERKVFGYDVNLGQVVSSTPYVGAPGNWALYGAASNPVPEPATLVALAAGAAALARKRRKR